jgi:5-methylthioadenosine/S-adenosylhomocysteine deaminase
MTSHIAETLEQAVTFKNKHGMSQVEFLQETGMLGPHFLLAHMNWVNDRDIAIVSRIGAGVAHNPFANMYFGEGVAPIPRMLDSNIRVALGTDSPSNGALDIFDVMKSCVLLHRIHHLNPEVIRPQHALDMATISGAEAVGMGGELGSIEVGKRADLVMIDLKALNLRPLHDVVSNIVMNGRADNVVSVILDGEFVLRDRKFIGIDEERVVHESESATARILDRLKYLEWFKKKHAKYRFSKS